jgi:hypothetical protein
MACDEFISKTISLIKIFLNVHQILLKEKIKIKDF